MEKYPLSGNLSTPPQPRGPFLPGAIVIATLSNPREKFWGMILALAPEGLSLSGAELASFEARCDGEGWGAVHSRGRFFSHASH
jgi:hypothetical protein